MLDQQQTLVPQRDDLLNGISARIWVRFANQGWSTRSIDHPNAGRQDLIPLPKAWQHSLRIHI